MPEKRKPQASKPAPRKPSVDRRLLEMLVCPLTHQPLRYDAERLGKSFEGREIWCATVTRLSTGPPDEKPAIWADGNIHATELTASVAALARRRR